MALPAAAGGVRTADYVEQDKAISSISLIAYQEVLRRSANVVPSFFGQLAAILGVTTFYKNSGIAPKGYMTGLPDTVKSGIQSLYGGGTLDLFTDEPNISTLLNRRANNYVTFVDDVRTASEIDYLLPGIEDTAFQSEVRPVAETLIANKLAVTQLKGTGKINVFQGGIALGREMYNRAQRADFTAAVLKNHSSVIDLARYDGVLQYIRLFGGMGEAMDKEGWRSLCAAVPKVANKNANINGQNPSKSPLYQFTVVPRNGDGALATTLDMLKKARNIRVAERDLVFFMDTFGYNQLLEKLATPSVHAEIKDLNESNMNIRIMNLFSPFAVQEITVGGIPVVHWANNNDEKRIFLCSPADLGITILRENSFMFMGAHGDSGFEQTSTTHAQIDVRALSGNTYFPLLQARRSLTSETA